HRYTKSTHHVTVLVFSPAVFVDPPSLSHSPTQPILPPHPAVNAKRIVVIDADMIELRHWEVLALPPFAAAVIRVPHSAVVSHKHHLRVGWVDPHVVGIAVRSLKTTYDCKTFASVFANNQ